MGNFAYKRDFSRLTDTSQKLKPSWKGPFRVKYLVGDLNARLENLLTGKEEKFLVNIDHLKSARERRELLRKYWPQTGHQVSPEPAPSTSQEMSGRIQLMTAQLISSRIMNECDKYLSAELIKDQAAETRRLHPQPKERAQNVRQLNEGNQCTELTNRARPQHRHITRNASKPAVHCIERAWTRISK